MSHGERDREALVSGLREVKETARKAEREPHPPPSGLDPPKAPPRLEPLPEAEEPSSGEVPASPDRDVLNESWDLASAEPRPPRGLLGRVLERLGRGALGPVLDRQTAMNSAQVRFDNEIVAYLDARLDRMSEHYDRVLGAHGRRMQEIDERHLILQQELVRHVHDLVERIEYVFETAETSHLHVEGMLRETQEELRRLAERIEALGTTRGDG